jgi:hypothetical protein
LVSKFNDVVKSFFAKWFFSLCEQMQDAKEVLYAALESRRAAIRARQCYTGACRPKMLRFISRQMQYTPETNPLREAVFPRRRNLYCFQKNESPRRSSIV